MLETRRRDQDALPGIAERSAERRARKDALLAIARDIPDPDDYAQQMSLELAEALAGATRSPQGYRVRPEVAGWMRPFGLVEYGGRHLTAFGSAVRQALLQEDA
jgi:hypothetical protein